jgi:hypothetical protein
MQSALGRQLVGCERSEHTELVAVRVGHHDPACVSALAHVDAAGTGRFKPGHFTCLIPGPQIQVEAVLALLLLGDAQEQQVRNDPVLGAGGWRLQNDLIGLFVRAAPPQGRLPEARKPRRIDRLNAEALNAEVHASIVALAWQAGHLIASLATERFASLEPACGPWAHGYDPRVTAVGTKPNVGMVLLTRGPGSS